MQLQTLARRNAECRVAQLVAQVEFSKHLRAGELAARNCRADHKTITLAALLAIIAVVLLVGAVMLEQLNARLAEKIVLVD